MDEKILELNDEEFDATMHGLAQAATQAIEERAAAVRSIDEERAGKAVRPAEPARPVDSSRPETPRDQPRETDERSLKAFNNLPEMLRQLTVGVAAVGRTAGEHTQILNKVEKFTADSAEAQQQLPKIVADLHALREERNTISRQMFDALHEELRSYKDGFLLDSVHRPMIRDLISLYDDLVEIHRQMNGAVAEQAGIAGTGPSPLAFLERLKGIDMHIEHNIDFVIEVLARLEVTQLPPGSGKYDKVSQRAVNVEMAEDPDEDMNIVRVFKRGFMWKGRVLRAEEVAIKKWKEGFLVAMQDDQDDQAEQEKK